MWKKNQQGLKFLFFLVYVVTQTRPQHHTELAKWSKGKRLSCNWNVLLFINPYPTPPSHLPFSEEQQHTDSLRNYPKNKRQSSITLFKGKLVSSYCLSGNTHCLRQILNLTLLVSRAARTRQPEPSLCLLLPHRVLRGGGPCSTDSVPSWQLHLQHHPLVLDTLWIWASSRHRVSATPLISGLEGLGRKAESWPRQSHGWGSHVPPHPSLLSQQIHHCFFLTSKCLPEEPSPALLRISSIRN